MISFDGAIELIASFAKPLGRETVAIAEAAGRVLAESVRAAIDSPRVDVSAMDGYAVRGADPDEVGSRFHLVGRSYPGAGWSGAIGPGECVRIFTGAPLPDGGDRIIIQENITLSGEAAIVTERSGNATFVRRRGSDFRQGDTLLPAGRLLDPRALVAAAAADRASVTVHRQPRIALLVTGDELAEPGSAAAATHAVPDSLSPGLVAFGHLWGATVGPPVRLRDDLDAMQRAAGDALDTADLVVVTAGASVGEKDYARAMFDTHGLELVFTRLSIKPGKPAWLGRAGGSLVLGLPGNPTSAMVTARLLLAPLLAGLSGRVVSDALGWRRVPLLSPLPACGERETFHRARWTAEGANVLGFQESHAQKALAEANLLIRQRGGDRALAVGEPVDVLDF